MLSVLTTFLFTFTFGDKCEYPRASDTTQAYERLAEDQETTLIPKVCFNANECGDDICARDPEVLDSYTGCIWCGSKNPNSCDSDPSDDTNDDDFYDCYELTAESCGCVDNRDVDIAVLMDVTGQTVETFNYYLLYFSYWFNEDILSKTDNTNIQYILYTDEVVYSGSDPADHYGFEMKDNEDLPEEMDDLPDDIDGADDPDFCVALEEMKDWFKKDGKYDTQLMYWIPTKDHDSDALKDCLDDDDELDDITTFALRFWSDTNLERFEDAFGDLDYCEYFQLPSYVPSEGNSPDARYFVLTMSDFICLDAAQLTDAPTNNPTENPTENPTLVPTVNPTLDPTENPNVDTDEPTLNPTLDPTQDPIGETDDPTANPTQIPSSLPSEQPSAQPTDNPTENPTENPSENPSEAPTSDPTDEPSYAPTDTPRGWWTGPRNTNHMNNRYQRIPRRAYRQDIHEWNEHAVRNDHHQNRWQENDDRWKYDMDKHWKLHWKSFYEDKCWDRDSNQNRYVYNKPNASPYN